MSINARPQIVQVSTSIVTVCLLFCIVCFANLAQANPENGTVIAGNVNIQQSDPNTLLINQSTGKAIIDWQSFNIAVNEHTVIQQPSSTAIILNRVIGADPSKIYGQLSANGRVVLINPAGIYFGPTARINVASLVATTANIRNEDFLSENYHFIQAPDVATSVINEGEIKAAEGLVALVAPGVQNSGVIQANLGKVVLASGNEFTVDLYGDQMINFVINNKVNKVPIDGDGKPLDAAVTNKGSIIADGGKILLTANVAQNVVQNVINMEGVAQARTVAQRAGEIILLGGEQGSVKVTGKLDVSGQPAGRKGGTVKILGQKIQVAKATIDASGDAGGGEILIGGNYQGKGIETNAKYTSIDKDTFINASALNNGDGGRVIVWSDDATDFKGNIIAKGGAKSGNGGFAEVSGKRYLGYEGFTDLSAVAGKTGELLLDPYNIIISAGADTTSFTNPYTSMQDTSVINVNTLANALATANVTIQTGAGGSQAGDVTFLNNLSWSSNKTLTVYAHRDIIVQGGVTISNSAGGSLVLRADSTGTGTGTVGFPDSSCITCGSINFSGGGSVKIYYNPTSYPTADDFSDVVTVSGGSTFTAYMLINSATQLQNMSSNLSGNYALAKDIDASSISNFVPVNNFTGKLDGNNHAITGLTINRPTTQHVGLFGLMDTVLIENLQILNANIVGGESAGILGSLARTNSVIRNVTTSGTVTADGFAGGLLGGSKSSSLVTDSSSSATVTATAGFAGGLIGASGVESLATTTKSYSTGIVSGVVAGGLVGGSIPSGSVISESYSTASVTGSTAAGGLVGRLFSGTTVTDSFSLGTVTGSDMVGGLVGSNLGGTISKSYSIGYVTGSGGSKGGLVGSNTGTVSNSFWNTETSGRSTSAGGTAATTSQLQTSTLFSNAGWNLSNTWQVVEGQIYPYLRNLHTTAPQVVSGNVFAQNGSTLGPNVAVALLNNGNLVTSVQTMANGAYYSFNNAGFSTSAAVLAYIADSSVKGNAVGTFSDSFISGLNIYGNTVTAKSGSNMALTNNIILGAKGSNTDSDIIFGGSNNNLTLNNGVSFQVLAGSPYALSGSINTTADMIFNGAINLTGAATLTTSNGSLLFNNTLDGNNNLTLNVLNGDITFVGNVGSNTPLNTLTVQNVRNLTVQQTLNVANYNQTAGSGTSNFGNNSLNASNQVSIIAALIQGHIIGNNVSLTSLNNYTASINANTLTLSGAGGTLTGLLHGSSRPYNGIYWLTNLDNFGTPEITLAGVNGNFTLNGYRVGASGTNPGSLDPAYFLPNDYLLITDFYPNQVTDADTLDSLIGIKDNFDLSGAHGICYL